MSAVRRDDRPRVFYEGNPLNAAAAIALGCLLLIFGGVVMGAGVTWWSVRKAVDRAVDVHNSSDYHARRTDGRSVDEVASLATDEESRKQPKPIPKPPKNPPSPPKPDPEEPKRPDPAVGARVDKADRLTGDPPLWIEPAKPGHYGPSSYEQ